MRLVKGQILYIDNQKYTVINMIEFKEDTWNWHEYEIVNDYNIHKWLSVEENENKQLEYYIYDVYRENINTNDIEFYADNKKYELYEKGQAIVKDYFGNADVDRYEKCSYFDYSSEDGKSIISVEMWEGEIEKSIGFKLESERLRTTNEIDHSKKTSSNKESKNIANICASIFALFFIMVGFISLISDISANKSMIKYLTKQTSKYTYVTSVTNNTNNKKAKVYKSTLSSIDLTVKDIIDGVPEAITKTIDSDTSTQEDGIGLHTNKEYAYIYEENGEIYIQVSEKEYINNNSGTIYHSRHRHYYYSTYSSTNESSTYSNYAYSARQNSVNSRTSSGGGTSSGK